MRRQQEDLKVQEAWERGETHYKGRRIIPGVGLEKDLRPDDGLPDIVAGEEPTLVKARQPRNPRYQPKGK